MNLIVVVDDKWGIGKNGGLLLHLPGELKYFKEKTIGKTIVMGRETLQTFPKSEPLPQRKNIVLSRNADFEASCLVCHSMGELFKTLESENMEDIFICGGENIYKQFSPYCNRYFVTKLMGEFQADKFFENLDLRNDLKIVWKSELQEENEILYHFLEYVKK